MRVSNFCRTLTHFSAASFIVTGERNHYCMHSEKLAADRNHGRKTIPVNATDSDLVDEEPPNLQSNPAPAPDDSQEEEKDPIKLLNSYGYVLQATIGVGSYGKVKKAYSNSLKRDVAIKVISLRKAKTEYVDKFLPRETDILRRLSHPSIIKFYTSIETTVRVFMVFDLADKGELLEVIKRMKFLREEQAGPWLTQILLGLHYIHEQGVAHRDMKCENVLLDGNFNVKISDFGFARLFPKKSQEEEYSRTYCGSYAYAAPEVLRGLPYHPHCADIWSVGVILFTMLTGRLPFNDQNNKRLLKQVTKPVVLPEKPPLTKEAKALIRKLLNPLVHKRASLLDLKQDLWFCTYLGKAPINATKAPVNDWDSGGPLSASES